MAPIHYLRHLKSNIVAVPAGLAWAQLVAFLAIHQSNGAIYQSVMAMSAEGWFAIPAGPALYPLTTWAAAFKGAIFFTLSIGAGLSLATWGAIRLWRFLFPRGHRWYRGVIAAAAILAVFVNARGWVWFPTVIVAGVIVITGLLSGISPLPHNRPARWWVPVTALALLTAIWALWATQLNQNLFIAIRDRLLLSNPIGSRVNDFYYRNTLYAAEIFKSFNQKTLRTCRIENQVNSGVARHITDLMAARNVLVIQADIPVDLTIRFTPVSAEQPRTKTEARPLSLVTKSNRRINTDLAQFMDNPSHWLTLFSNQGDRYGPFRQLTFVTLLAGFPILLYALVYGIIRRISGIFLTDTKATWTTAAICLVVGILLFIPVAAGQSIRVAEEEINGIFKSGTWPQRVAAMQRIERDKLEIARFPSYRELLHDSTPVERYYLARVLALSKDTATYRDLLTMLSDTHPNVVCQVYYALGRRGRKAAVPLIIDNIKQSAHWYTQWYGYGALRNLGWRQTRSKQYQ